MIADTSIEDIVLEILFLTFSNTNIEFNAQSFIWRSYSTAKALSTTRQVELIDKPKFVKIVLNKNSEIFIVYVAALKFSKLAI